MDSFCTRRRRFFSNIRALELGNLIASTHFEKKVAARFASACRWKITAAAAFLKPEMFWKSLSIANYPSNKLPWDVKYGIVYRKSDENRKQCAHYYWRARGCDCWTYYIFWVGSLSRCGVLSSMESTERRLTRLNHSASTGNQCVVAD